jgi:small subunit ribosomal protein S11
MGKKHVIEKTGEDILAEESKVEKSLAQSQRISLRKKSIDQAVINILASYNNTKISLADSRGNILLSQSAGKVGFKGSKKGTSFAASKVAQAIGEAIEALNVKEAEVVIKGVGAGRESALRSLATQGVNIVKIQDRTPVPHGGCRPRKARRV